MSDALRSEDEGDTVTVSLVRLAGTRPIPSIERVAAARARVHAAWRKGVARRRWQRALVLAAAGLAAAGVALVAGREPGPQQRPAHASPAAAAPVVARLDAAAGGVELEGATGWAPLAMGDALCAGARVRTGPWGAGLRVDDGRSVRLAAHSRLLWAAADRVALESGAVYVDSGSEAADSGFEVETWRGRVRETGTQFEVALDAAGLRVRVREGRVSVTPGAARANAPSEELTSGVELRIDEHGARRAAISVHGGEWAWVLGLGPGYDMEGRTLHDLATWAAREAGWQVRYAGAEARQRARSALLHGSVRGLRADEALVAVIPSTGLTHRLEGGVFWIGVEAAASEAR